MHEAAPDAEFAGVDRGDRLEFPGAGAVTVVPAIHGVTVAHGYPDDPRFVGYVLELAGPSSTTRATRSSPTRCARRWRRCGSTSRCCRSTAAPTTARPRARRQLDGRDAVALATEVGASILVPCHWDLFRGNTEWPGRWWTRRSKPARRSTSSPCVAVCRGSFDAPVGEQRPEALQRIGDAGLDRPHGRAAEQLGEGRPVDARRERQRLVVGGDRRSRARFARSARSARASTLPGRRGCAPARRRSRPRWRARTPRRRRPCTASARCRRTGSGRRRRRPPPRAPSSVPRSGPGRGRARRPCAAAGRSRTRRSPRSSARRCPRSPA